MSYNYLQLYSHFLFHRPPQSLSCHCHGVEDRTFDRRPEDSPNQRILHFSRRCCYFSSFYSCFFFFDFLRVLRIVFEKIFVHVHFAIFDQYLNQIILTLIIYLVLASLLTNKLINNAPYILMVLAINLVSLVLLSFDCKISFIPLFL